MTELIVAFRKFANATKNYLHGAIKLKDGTYVPSKSILLTLNVSARAHR